jgi:hypothetical protein
MKSLLILISVLSLTGCSILPFDFDKVEPIEVVTVAKPKAPLNLPNPPQIKPQEIKWIVITPENAKEVFAKLQKNGSHTVLFGLTDDGYEALSINMAKIKGYIDSQRSIIIQYKDYYEEK